MKNTDMAENNSFSVCSWMLVCPCVAVMDQQSAHGGPPPTDSQRLDLHNNAKQGEACKANSLSENTWGFLHKEHHFIHLI